MITLFIIGVVLSSFHSTSGISNITAYEGDDVEFRWTNTTAVDGIKWYKGTSSDETLMEWLSGTVTKYIENIEYINEPNSAGMTLLDVTLSQNGLYTVVMYTSTGGIEESYTYLEVNPKPGLSTTMIIIIVVVVVVVCAILVVIIVCVLKKKKKNDQMQKDMRTMRPNYPYC